MLGLGVAALSVPLSTSLETVAPEPLDAHECTFESDTQNEFCRQTTPSGRQAAFERYEVAKHSCDWQQHALTAVPYGMVIKSFRWDNRSHTIDENFNPSRTDHAQNLTTTQMLRTCLTRPSSQAPDPTARWQIFQIGPFVTSGGLDWNEVEIDDVMFAVERNTSFFINAAWMAAVDPSGRPIEYPPLHTHHMHITSQLQSFSRAATDDGYPSINAAFVNKSATSQVFDEYTWHVHGDSICPHGSGGTTCGLLSFPDGYGHLYKGYKKLFYNAEVNDQRAPDSPPMEWWMEVALRVSTADLVPVSKMLSSGVSGKYPGYRAPYQFETAQGLTILPADMEDSMGFYSVPMHQAGRFVHLGTSLSHAHQSFQKGYIIFTGTPKDGGLLDLPHAVPEPSFSTREAFIAQFLAEGKMLPLPSNNLSIEIVIMHVRRSLSAARVACASGARVCPYVPRWRCSGGPGLEFVRSDAAGIVGAYYDRQVPPECDKAEWTYKRGDVFTVVSFFGKVHPEDGFVADPYGMHPFSFAALLIDAAVDQDRHNLSAYEPNYRYMCLAKYPQTAVDMWNDNFILPLGHWQDMSHRFVP